MSRQAWQARISCRGAIKGAGFLVTNRHVITCAHVVAGNERAEVYFVQRGDVGTIGARVIDPGPWAGRKQDPGDVAVLELDSPVETIEPAVFATVDAAYGAQPPRLIAYGFPSGYDEGTLGEYYAVTDQSIADEWVELTAWTSHGRPLDRGFSGAAVALANSGEIVGMISADMPELAGRAGRMLPAHVLPRYWEPAGDLIPTPSGLPRLDKRKLRELLGRTTVDVDPLSLYRDTVGPLAPYRPFATLWQAAWYLMTEVQSDSGSVPVAEFVLLLAGYVEDHDLRRALQDWAVRHGVQHIPGTSPAKRRWSPILVEIDYSGAGPNTFLVEVCAFRDGHRILVGTRTLQQNQVRGHIQEWIDEAFLHIEGEELLAFAVPQRWLNEPVDRWERGMGDPSPLGSFSPVVVMDVDRRRVWGSQHHITKMWEEVLDTRRAISLRRVECGSTEHPTRLTAELRQNSPDLLGFAAPPKSPTAQQLLKAGLNAPVPIMMWSRVDCPRDHAQHPHCDNACPGRKFLDRLGEELATRPPGELPHLARQLRLDALSHDGEEPHWAERFTLLWEDPRLFPEAAAYSRSPVG